VEKRFDSRAVIVDHDNWAFCMRATTATISTCFCELWRFRNGRIIEQLESAYDAAALGQFLMGETQSAVS